MKSFLNSCNSGKPADPAEVKAILFAAGACVLFIGFLTAFQRSETRHHTVVTSYKAPPPAVPVPPVTITEPPPPPAVDMNARFRVVPANFRGINFMTHNYGTYEFSDGSSRDLVLVDGKSREFENSQQQLFDLVDVLYTDLTGDGSPEAIVLLTHLECSPQCDGGKNLVYVYSQNDQMQEILKFESGSGIDGCSLKSINVMNGRLTLDLFGKCPQSLEASPEPVKRDTLYVTRVEYVFNGTWLVPKKRSYVSVPDRHEENYGVEKNIVDRHVPASHELKTTSVDVP